ncbi:hypothetical protein M409DRAFT_49990 [Zasmidium cellare ATCC 36951]|uniref:Uncharacterized protein n=1 Tax=Zasmidium cellare ATCC 36951 TaxID=1080233 RepID=A0A6A6D1H1_ZASCE|nr:uncharacterized protein M409DRAFT_49990 [Zasmidium cellare ATCC 36951]KAF2172268.1 hypothetical protein M409DRAFT_49990 [Zasmidium cellare ATCC 36951]
MASSRSPWTGTLARGDVGVVDESAGCPKRNGCSDRFARHRATGGVSGRCECGAGGQQRVSSGRKTDRHDEAAVITKMIEIDGRDEGSSSGVATASPSHAAAAGAAVQRSAALRQERPRSQQNWARQEVVQGRERARVQEKRRAKVAESFPLHWTGALELAAKNRPGIDSTPATSDFASVSARRRQQRRRNLTRARRGRVDV